MKLFACLCVLLLPGCVVGQSIWLPDAEQKHNAALWAWTGVEMPPGAYFYSCKPAFQHVARNQFMQPIYLLCSADYALVANDDNVNKLGLWRAPGGLSDVDRSQWRNATAVYLPKPVQVRKGSINMPNAGTLPIWRWSYPDGTLFADMLVRRHNGQEWPFELRIREKVAGKWDDGTVYRPYAGESSLPPGAKKTTWTMRTHPGEKLSLLGVDKLQAKAYVLPDDVSPSDWPAFKPSTTVVTGASAHGAIPPGFAGNVVRCLACHQNAGQAPGYASVIRGDDTVLSFHPFEPSSVSPNGGELPVRFNPEVVGKDTNLPTGPVNVAPRGGGQVRIFGGGKR